MRRRRVTPLAGVFLTAVAFGSGEPARTADMAIPPPRYEDVLAESTLLVLIDGESRVSESWRGELAVGAAVPAEAAALAPVRPAVVGRTSVGWYAGAVRLGGLVTLRPPGSGEAPVAITLDQLRGLVKTGRLPPYRVRAQVVFPADESRRELVATWADEWRGGPATVTGLTREPLAGGTAYVKAEFVLLDVRAGDLTLYFTGAAESVEGDTIVARLAVREPALLSAAELTAVLASGRRPTRVLVGEARLDGKVAGLVARPGAPVAVRLAMSGSLGVGSTLAGLAAKPLEYASQEELAEGYAYGFELGRDRLELVVGPPQGLDPVFRPLDRVLVLAARDAFRGTLRLNRGGRVTTVGRFALRLAP